MEIREKKKHDIKGIVGCCFFLKQLTDYQFKY